MKKLGWIIFIIIVLVLGWLAIKTINSHYAVTTFTMLSPTLAVSPSPTQTTLATNTKTSLLLPVPFTSQAPTGNWDQIHNEDCEEAVSLMANQYFTGNHSATLDTTFVDSEETMLNNWENQHLGYSLDTTSAETAQMIQQVYGLQTQMIQNFTAADLKNALDQNRLIIISEDGQLLNNPNYKSPGPIHHMLLIKGYDSSGFITNDSGTRNGRNYFYTFDTIYNAAADWDHQKNTVDQTQKIAIVVWK